MVLIGLVTAMVFVDPLLEGVRKGVEITKLELVIGAAKDALGVGNQFFVADVDQLVLPQRGAIAMERIVHFPQTVDHVLAVGLRERFLERLPGIERQPEAQGGRKERTRVAGDVNEFRAGERFRERRNPPGVRRAFENDAAGIGHEQCAKKVLQTVQPPRNRIVRDALEVEVLHIGRGIPRESDPAIRRGESQIHEREFIFLGAIPAGDHIIHRSLGWEEPIPKAAKEPLAHQKMVRSKTLVRIRTDIPRVEHQQFVEEGRTAPPVADNEDRIGWDGDFKETLAVAEPLKSGEEIIERSDDRESTKHREPRRGDSHLAGAD